MESRYITVPAAVAVPVGTEFVPWDFAKFIKDRTADSSAFGTSLDGVLAAADIRTAAKGLKPGEVMQLELASWELLCASIRTPGVPYLPDVMIHLIPHAKAVLDAPSTKP